MSKQLNMFALGVTSVADSSKLTREQFYQKFSEQNPHVYKLLVRLSREFLAQTGRRQFGIRLVWERLRWDFAVHASSADAYRLNNILTPFYAREIMQRETDLAGVFQTRERGVAA